MWWADRAGERVVVVDVVVGVVMVTVGVWVTVRMEGVEGKRDGEGEGERARLGRDWERGEDWVGDWVGRLWRIWGMGGDWERGERDGKRPGGRLGGEGIWIEGGKGC